MPVINQVPRPGGGKWELLWPNPNPNVAFSTTTDVAIDWSKYQHVFVLLKYASDSAYQTELHEIKHDMTFSGRNTTMVYPRPEQVSGGVMTVAYRQYQINSNGIRIFNVGGYANVNSTDKQANNVFCIPVTIYGVKRLNLG